MLRPSPGVALASAAAFLADRKIQPGRTALLGRTFRCRDSPSYRYAPGFARIGTNEVKAFRKRRGADTFRRTGCIYGTSPLGDRRDCAVNHQRQERDGELPTGIFRETRHD